jgi:hypothetical protein
MRHGSYLRIVKYAAIEIDSPTENPGKSSGLDSTCRCHENLENRAGGELRLDRAID